MAYRKDYTKEDGLFVGDDILLRYEVFKDDLVVDAAGAYVSGTPQDVTGWTFRWELRRNDRASDPAILSKTTAITITGTYDAVRASNTQRVLVPIDDTETYSDAGSVLIPPATYRFSMKRDDPGSEKTIVYGKFPLLEVPARL